MIEKEGTDMKKFLLPENGNFYKANLHCHSTISDGHLTPEQLKEAYLAKGYSIIAYTDHDVMIPHPELADENFLPLTSYEMEVTEPKKADFSDARTCHLCYIALSPENTRQVCYHRSAYVWGNAVPYRSRIDFDHDAPDYVRRYTAEGINDMIRIGRENGFFVTYNHPTWSLEDESIYSGYEGMNAMEICNYGCVCMGYDDRNSHQYDDLLRQGKRIFCIATDDNHNRYPATSRHWDSFGGFTVIKADKLEYKTITDALVKGDFYASEAPLINELWFEDGRIHVTCSSADRVMLTTGIRAAEFVYDESGEGITEAEFEVKPNYGYVRLTVIDKQGYSAYTNAYFTDELFS